ncbi:MAG TPA: HAMP domain-containing sensor histidine kinase [Coriobacteriia bacterium]|nr:HAMP domain-containing sensor histidine kinase [Coriobacteriia bacterium]
MKGTLRQRIALLVLGAAVFGAVVASVVMVVPSFSRPAALQAVAFVLLVPAIVSALLAALVSQWIARRFASPVERLAATTSSFAAGDYTQRARTDGPREVRLIAQSFNRMAADFSTAIDELNSEETRKTQFVSDVSHELRTPLTAIRGAAETLLDGGVGPDDQERFLSTIAAEAERLTRLANDLLALQRIEGATGELPFRSMDLREAAERAVAMLEPLIEDRGVTVEVRGSAPRVLGDVDRLQQVVANLVDNASRMVGDGGHVWVEFSSDAGYSVMAVRDDGPGIPERDLPHLFDRFYRADTSRTRTSGGSGLGLAIVRAIVGAHSGTIEAENLPERGARLIVKLPSLPE